MIRHVILILFDTGKGGGNFFNKKGPTMQAFYYLIEFIGLIKS